MFAIIYLSRNKPSLLFYDSYTSYKLNTHKESLGKVCLDLQLRVTSFTGPVPRVVLATDSVRPPAQGIYNKPGRTLKTQKLNSTPDKTLD